MQLQDIKPGTHICLIYSDRAEAVKEVTAFIAHALQNDGYTHYFTVESSEEELTSNLEKCHCSHHQIEDRFVVSQAKQVYTPDGVFDRQRMLNLLGDTYQADQKRHQGPVHYTGEMSWALESGVVTAEELARYEREVNDIIIDNPFSAVCQYDASKFSPELLSEILRAHPYILVDGMVIQSPHYEA